MKFSEKFDRVKPSATLAVNAKTLELKAQGVKILSLAVGEPDFPTPAHICEAAKAAIDAGFTRYTAVTGIMELRQAVGAYFMQYGVEVPASSVVVSNGGKQTLYNILQALLNPGDEVLIPAPYWVSYPDMVALACGVPVEVPASVDAQFKVTPSQLEGYVTPKTRVLILNSPSNPTGAVYTQAELDAIMQWAMDKNLFVLSDEIYDQLVYAPAQVASAIGWWQRYPDNVAVCNGVAKSFAMTGWRVGYSVTSLALAKVISVLQGQSTSNVCSIAQKAALAALQGPKDCVDAMRVAFTRRRDKALAAIQGWSKAVCPKPDGAFYIFVDVHKYFDAGIAGREDAVALCTTLLEKARVAVVPGTAFGDPKCIRLSYATADDILEEALERIKSVLES